MKIARQRFGFVAALLMAVSANAQSPQAPPANHATSTKPFVNVTRESGVADAVAHHYEVHPKWWLSGVNLVDLDGDGKLDLFLAAHGAGVPLALLDDGLCFGDIDGDGDLDIIGYTGSLDGKRMINVYRNGLPSQNWLRVRPIGAPGNRGAAGAKIRITEAGSDKLLWFEQVQILDSQSAHSYYSLAPTERHFGLGARDSVDVSVEFYPSGKRVEKKAMKSRSILSVPEEPK